MLLAQHVNADGAAARRRDPANELAGIDLRLRRPLAWRCAACLQLNGEDEARLLPSRFLGLYEREAWSACGTPSRWGCT